MRDDTCMLRRLAAVVMYVQYLWLFSSVFKTITRNVLMIYLRSFAVDNDVRHALMTHTHIRFHLLATLRSLALCLSPDQQISLMTDV